MRGLERLILLELNSGPVVPIDLHAAEPRSDLVDIYLTLRDLERRGVVASAPNGPDEKLLYRRAYTLCKPSTQAHPHE